MMIRDICSKFSLNLVKIDPLFSLKLSKEITTMDLELETLKPYSVLLNKNKKKEEIFD